MDALTKLNENFLSCNICTEIYKDPCTLGCYHTFCRGCLTKYTKTRRDAIDAKSILCPNCNQMSQVPRPQETVDQWCHQFKPSFLVQGLLDTFSPQDDSDPVEQCCFTCQQIEKTTQAKSVCEDCDIELCESCVKMHVATPMAANHVISPLGASSTPQLRKRRVMCKEHNCLVEFCCKTCRKAVCSKCAIFYHRKCHAIFTIESMIPEMKQVLQQSFQDINSHMQQAGNTLEGKKSEVEDLTKHKSSLETEIRRVSQQAADVIRSKEKKLLDELDTVFEKQTGELRSQIKSGEIHIQTYQQHTEFIKQVLQSNSPVDLFDMYTLCQSGEITAEKQSHSNKREKRKKVEFKNKLDVDRLKSTLNIGHLKFTKDKSILHDAPVPLSVFGTISNLQDKPKLVSIVSAKSSVDEGRADLGSIEVFNIDGTETLVVADFINSNVKSCFTKGGKPYCTYIKLEQRPMSLTKVDQDRVAVPFTNSFILIKLTPDPVLMSTIETKKEYCCMAALSDTTLVAGFGFPISFDVLDLSGRVLRCVTIPNSGQQLMVNPQTMCITRQGHIVVTVGVEDDDPAFVFCVTQQGEILYMHTLASGSGGVTTTDNGSVLVGDFLCNKIVQLTETGEFLRDLLTYEDRIVRPQGVRVHGNKLYVTEQAREHVKIFQL